MRGDANLPANEPTHSGGPHPPPDASQTDDWFVAQQAAVLEALRDRLWDRLAPMPLAVMLDSTTFVHAGRALGSAGPPDAYDLLDLSVLTVAVVFFDYVIIQPDLISKDQIDQVVPSGVMPDMLYELEPERSDTDELAVLYGQALQATQDRKRRHEKRWKILLDRDVDLDIVHANPVYAIEEYLSAVPKLRGDDAELNAFASQHTVRAEFNDRVAGALGLPYLPSSVRLAPASELVKSHNEMLKALRQVAAIGTPAQEPTPASSYLAPFLLGVVLDEMDSPRDFAPWVGRLRDEFAEFRTWVREHPDRAGWHDRPQTLYQDFPTRLAKTLSPSATRGKTTMATIQGAASFTPAKPFVDSAATVVKAARESTAVARHVARLFRPEVFTLLSVSAEANQVPTFTAQIRKIWGDELSDANADALKEISGFKGDVLLTPRALD